MINETHDTYQYLRPKSDSFSKSDFIIPGKEPIDIILELNHLNAINNSLLGIILDLNKDQLSSSSTHVKFQLSFSKYCSL